LEPKDFTKKISDVIFNKKGYDVIIMDLRNLAAFADFFVICSADSDVQVKAIADEVDKSFREKGIKCWHKEGYTALQWVLLDYIDVVVHIFRKNARDFYNLEKLWGDAPTEKIKDAALQNNAVKTATAKSS
jgi:ribosome-associated protein